MKKRLVSLVMCVTMFASSFIPSISVFAINNQTKIPDVQGVLDFSCEENVVNEEVDSYGNPMFLVETVLREVENFNEVNLTELSVSFTDDSNTEAQITGNTLSYTLPDGTQGEIVETIDSYGRRIIQVSEGNKFNEIIFDAINKQVKLDGEVVTFYESQTFVIEQENSFSPRSQQWTYLATTNHNMRAQQVIRSLTSAAVITLVSLVP